MSGMTLGAADWLAGNQTKNPSKRNISLSVAELKVHEKNIQKRGRQAGGYIYIYKNYRYAFKSSYSSYLVLSKVVWQVEPLQPLNSNRSRLTVGKRNSSNKAS